MTETQARYLTEQLFAAFPDRNRSGDTREVYVDHLTRLADFEVAGSVLDSLIESEAWLPSIAAIRTAYQEWRRAHPQPALPEPDLTSEQRAEGARRARELAERFTVKSFPDDQ